MGDHLPPPFEGMWASSARSEIHISINPPRGLSTLGNHIHPLLGERGRPRKQTIRVFLQITDNRYIGMVYLYLIKFTDNFENIIFCR